MLLNVHKSRNDKLNLFDEGNKFIAITLIEGINLESKH